MVLGYVNVTEAQLITVATFLITAFNGTQFWNRSVLVFGFKIEYKILALSMGWAGSIITSLSSVLELNRHYGEKKIKKNDEKSKDHPKEKEYLKRLNLNLAFLQMMPIIIASVFPLVWAIRSPEMIAGSAHFFYLSIGFSVAGIVGRLVVARVCEKQFSLFQPLLLPLFIGVLNTFLHFIDERILVRTYAIYAIFGYLHFSLSIIHDFCDHLGINCLTIRK